MNNSLEIVRVRHSMLIGIYVQMNNYFECLSRGYLGELDPKETILLEDLKKTMVNVEKVMEGYFDSESKIME
jgi:hypothetical protein